MRISIFLTVGVFAALLLSVPATPQSRNEKPGGLRKIQQMSGQQHKCGFLSGKARRMCFRYCESLDCDVEDRPQCESLRNRFERSTGNSRFPCDPISIGQCAVYIGEGPDCNELGGKLAFDTTCPPITGTSSLGCITDCSNEDLCTGQLGGIVAPTVAGCPSGFECFAESKLFLKCLEDLCPHSSDEVEYLDVDNVSGNASFRNLNDGRTYDCTVVFDRSDDGFDCAADPRVGDIAVIVIANSRSDVICTGGFAIALDVVPGFPAECTYACDGL